MIFRFKKLKKIRCIFFLIALALLIITDTASAFIRDGAVSGRSGLSFSSVSYQFDTLYVTIRNRNKSNVTFGGTMVFLDRHHREIARAELNAEKIKRRSSRRFRGVFVKGSGNEAKAASFLIWEL